MAQSFPSLSSHLPLMVRDDHGSYIEATPHQVLEAARQVISGKTQRDADFTSPDVVKAYMCTKLAGFGHPVLALLFLDLQHRPIKYVELFHSTITMASVYPREMVKEALRCDAASVILAHNHPSGHPESGHADQVIAPTLRQALALIELRILDHIIVTGMEAISLAERGLI